MGRITPVILSGGAGTRLWPVSTPQKPKQFQMLVSGDMMIADTASRVTDANLFQPALVIGSRSHQHLLREALHRHAPRRYVLEPVGRNTAAAIAIAALLCEDRPDEPILILPSDHAINNTSGFIETVRMGAVLARMGKIVTFGITPTEAHTGYGYIERGETLEHMLSASDVARFVEKPNTEAAIQMLESGNFLWNSGMFMASPRRLIEEFALHAPELLKACRDTLTHSANLDDMIYLNEERFATTPSQAFDIAVMEKTQHAVVIPAAFDWSDVGSWAALHSLMRDETHGNVLSGVVQANTDVRNSFVRNDTDLPVFLSGVSDLIVVLTKDGLVVTTHAAAQSVKKAAEKKA
jgi:mannose-1-phosphate guanylyltransferase/mannose-6-phosphate isomerase